MSPRQTETARRQERTNAQMTTVWHAIRDHHIRGDWRDDAACQGIDPIIFVGDDTAVRGQPKDLVEQFRQAQAICLNCPVRLDCLTYAVATRSYGVWGGHRFGAHEIAALNRIEAAEAEGKVA